MDDCLLLLKNLVFIAKRLSVTKTIFLFGSVM